MSLTPRSTAHGRSPSGRVALTRRMTRGPLDADDALDDPLAPDAPTGTAASTAASTTASPSTANTPSRLLSPTRSPLVSPAPAPSSHGLPESAALDVSFLQDPAAYHVLPTTAPLPFQQAANHPSVAAPIDSLLLSGHYRLAAIAAARNIVSAAAPTDYPTLFHLVHIRLACLCLINEHALAAQEAKVLGDLSSAFYRHPLTSVHLVPWDLRLLVVRLTALGYGEWRKAIMGYYELARECRESILRAADESEKALWRGRLRDCGIRVANTLVEMGDLEGAGRHLATLSNSGSGSDSDNNNNNDDDDDGNDNNNSNDNDTDSSATRELLVMETLVWLRLGDLASARRCLSHSTTLSPSPLLDDTLTALLHLSSGDYPAATHALQTLHAQHPTDAMVAQNLAVCLLYTGHIADAKSLLASQADAGPPFYSLLFNLSTVFELCTERHRERKGEVAEMLAQRKGGAGVGWERSVGEFKL